MYVSRFFCLESIPISPCILTRKLFACDLCVCMRVSFSQFQSIFIQWMVYAQRIKKNSIRAYTIFHVFFLFVIVVVRHCVSTTKRRLLCVRFIHKKHLLLLQLFFSFHFFRCVSLFVFERLYHIRSLRTTSLLFPLLFSHSLKRIINIFVLFGFFSYLMAPFSSFFSKTQFFHAGKWFFCFFCWNIYFPFTTSDSKIELVTATIYHQSKHTHTHCRKKTAYK